MVVVLSALSVSTFQPRDVGEEMNQGCPQTPRHTPSRGWLSLGRVTPGLPGSRVMLRQASSNERLFSIELLQSTEQLVLCFMRPHKAPGHYVHSPSYLKLFIKPCDRSTKHPTETIGQKPQSALSDTDLQSSYLSFCFECVCLFLREKKKLPQSTCERLFV